MRYLDRSKLAQGPHRVTVRRSPVWLSLLAGVSVLAMMTAEPARAQDATYGGDFAVDVSDPSVSIDLSVLNDSGLSSPSNLPMSSSSPSRSGAYQMPGTDMPVSTLYVQPTESFTLPQQTKNLIAKPAPEVEPTTDVVEDMSAPADSNAEIESATDTVPEAPALEEPVAEAPMAEEPVAAPKIAAPAAPETPTQEAAPETAKAEPEPAPAPELKPEPEPEVAAPVPTPAPVQETAKAEPAPALASTPMKDVAETEPTPAPEPAPEATPTPAEPEVAADAAAQVPPPPPQALTQTPPTAPSATTPTQPDVAAATPGAVVVDLPPKLEEQQQPGVASLPSATGPLSDGDNMRIVFEQDSSKLSGDVRDALKTLSDRLGQQESLRLQLLAYAGDDNTSASAARRLSLSRALAVRSYLIENGVRSTRIDVRALGNKSTEAVTERVDITIVER